MNSLSSAHLTISTLLTFPWLFVFLPADAQIIPDDTLGAERSTVQAIDEFTDRIGQGAMRGENLFHSFQEFNVDEGRGAYFANPDGIRNILSRVTGDDVSDIFGTLGVEGDANLFFLNPNGIVFGPNAQLDVAGSFVASTADRFSFDDGSSFSATEPDAPPLLTVNVTPGLQMGAGQGPIVSDAQLLAGQDLVLDGSVLDLQGWLAVGEDLLLQGDQVQIRDSVDAPFVAEAGGSLTVAGNTVDIFALNHADSGLVSGGDMVLRSSSPVVGDAHYWSGGGFRIETPDGGLGMMESPNDPVIRVAGDVAFDSYTGASLHIFAGGSVMIPGAIEITGADPVNGLVETVVLSDGSVVEIDGRSQPTLDIRAGMMVVPDGDGATEADIQIGNIRNDGGTVFLTNQYQPNFISEGGNIQVGGIDTSAVEEVLEATDGKAELRVQGGNVVVDGRGEIQLIGNVDTSANGTIGNLGEGLAEVIGGKIHLIADNNIETQNMASSSTVRAEGTFPDNDLSGNITATAIGGEIIVNSQSSIITNNVYTGSYASIAGYNLQSSEVRGGNELSDISLTANGGDITLESQESLDIGSLYTSGTRYIFIRNPSEIGDVNLVSHGGDITLNTNSSIITGDLETSLGEGRNTYIYVDKIGDVNITSTGGNIIANTQEFITTGDLSTSTGAGFKIQDRNRITSELGHVDVFSLGGNIALNARDSIIIGDLNTRASSSGYALARTEIRVDSNITEDITGGEVGDININVTGGNLTINTQTSLVSGDVDTSAGVALATSSHTSVYEGYTFGQGRDYASISGNVTGGKVGNLTVTVTGGDISLDGLEYIRTNYNSASNIQSSASAGIYVEAIASTDVTGEIIGELEGGEVGNIIITVTGGDINQSSQGSITTASLNTSANVDTDYIPENLGLKLFGVHLDSLLFDNRSNHEPSNMYITASGGIVLLDAQESIVTQDVITTAEIETNVTDLLTLKDNLLSDINIKIIGGDISLNSQEYIRTENAFSTVDANIFSDAVNENLDHINTASIGGVINLISPFSLLFLKDGISINSSVIRGNGNAGNIRLEGKSIALNNNTLTTTSFGEGDAGDINIVATDEVVIEGSRLLAGREPHAEGQGIGGNINISGTSITLNDFSFLNTASLGVGNAGDINLYSTQGNIILNDSSIFSLTAVEGNSGSILLQSAGEIQLNGQSTINTSVGIESAGRGGNIVIKAEEGVFIAGPSFYPTSPILASDPVLEEIEPNHGDGFFFAPVFGDEYIPGNDFENTQKIDSSFALANNPNVLFSNDVPHVTILGTGEDPGYDQDIFSVDWDAASFDYYSFEVDSVGTQIILDIDHAVPDDPAETFDIGLELFDVQGNQLAFNDNASVALGTEGSSSSQDPFLAYIFNKPGTYVVRVGEVVARDTTTPIRLIQTDGTYILNVSRIDNFLVSSGITTQTRSSGRSGDITINAPIIDIQNGGQISAETLNEGRAGDITLQPFTDGSQLDIRLRGKDSQISGSTIGTGDSGDLTISASESINIQGDGRIAIETSGAGHSGELRLNTGTLNIQDGITISAQSNSNATGNAGDIIVNATDSFTLNNGSQLSVETNSFGTAGNVTVHTPILTVASDAAITATATNTAAPTSQGGSIFLNASTMDLSGRVGVFSETQGDAPAGRLVLKPYQDDPSLDITLRNVARVSASTIAAGEGGDLQLFAPESISIQGDGRVAVETTGTGNAGNLTIETGQLTIQDGAIVTAQSNLGATGNAGSITVDASDRVTLREGSQLSVETNGPGAAGNITINTAFLAVETDAAVTATATRTATPTSQGGNIFLNASTMDLEGEVGVFSETQGQAPAGRLALSPFGTDPTLDITLRNNARVSASTTSTGQGGNVELVAPQSISIRGDGRVAVETTGAGAGGRLRLNTQQLTVSNGALLTAESTGTGAAGSIDIDVERLTLRNGAQANVSSSGTTQAGDLAIRADTVVLTHQAALIAETEAGSGANIALQIQDSLRVANNSRVSATTQDGRGGSITIGAEHGNTTRTVRLTGQSQITASTGSGNGGKIQLSNLDTLQVHNSQIAATAQDPEGTAGAIDIHALEDILLSGRFNPDQRGGISVSAEGGTEGSITVTTSDLDLANGTEISVRNAGAGNAGNLSITADNVTMQGDSILNAETEAGSGGNVQLHVNDTLRLQNDSEISTSTESGIGGNIRVTEATNIYLGNSAISSSAETGKAGRLNINASEQIVLSGDRPSGAAGGLLVESIQGTGGNLMVQTNQLTADNGAAISVATDSGIAGDVTVTANNSIRLRGKGTEISAQARHTGGEAGSIIVTTNELTMHDRSVIVAANENATQSGNIQLMGLDILDLNNSRIDATTNTGEAGDIAITATNFVHLHNGAVLSVESASPQNTNAVIGTSRSTARTGNRTFTPRAGDLSIETDRLMVTDGSSIFIRSLNGQAGNIDITANQVELDTGEIRATTRENPASDRKSANINITGLEWLTLDNNSLLSAEALPGANGGNIVLDADGGIILATSRSNSDIVATAVDGNGGRIEIAAFQVLGFQENSGSFSQLRDNQTNDISATSITGADGDVVVDSDPFQVEVDVPVDTTPPPLDQGCRDSTDSQGHFVNRERGGIPLNPDDPISSDLAWEDLYPPNSITQSTPTTEANRWHINEAGQIVQKTPQAPQASPFTCPS